MAAAAPTVNPEIARAEEIRTAVYERVARLCDAITVGKEPQATGARAALLQLLATKETTVEGHFTNVFMGSKHPGLLDKLIRDATRSTVDPLPAPREPSVPRGSIRKPRFSFFSSTDSPTSSLATLRESLLSGDAASKEETDVTAPVATAADGSSGTNEADVYLALPEGPTSSSKR